MTAVRRSTGPKPGGTDEERASGTTTKILSRWSGGYRDKYGCTRKGGGGGEGRRETGTAGIERELERSSSRHATRATTGDETRDSRTLRGAPSPAGTARIERELESQRPERYLGDAWQRDKTRDSRTLRGVQYPKPLHQHPIQVPPAAQVGGGSRLTTIGTLGRTTGAAWHRPPVSSGGRRVTTSAPGGEDT